MGFPQGDDLVQSTNPYYRTAYALVFKPGGDLDGIDSLADERLKQKRIGIVAGTPPATYLAANGLLGQDKPYALMVDTRVEFSAEAMIKDLKAGEIDVGVLWGPMAGFFARQANPAIQVVPLLKETGGPRLAYRIGMGVRAADQNWKRELNRLIQENQPEINKLLLGYGVPLLDEKDQPDHGRLVDEEAMTAIARRFVMFALALLALAPVSVLGQDIAEPEGYRDGELSCADARHARGARVSSPPPKPSRSGRMAGRSFSMCCRTRRARPICRPERSGGKSRGGTFPAASGCPIPDMARLRRSPRTTCEPISRA